MRETASNLAKNMIVERTKEGKAIARQNPDFREGRPHKYNRTQINHAMELLENYSYKQVEQMTGISKSTLIRAKRKEKCQYRSKKIIYFFLKSQYRVKILKICGANLLVS